MRQPIVIARVAGSVGTLRAGVDRATIRDRFLTGIGMASPPLFWMSPTWNVPPLWNHLTVSSGRWSSANCMGIGRRVCWMYYFSSWVVILSAGSDVNDKQRIVCGSLILVFPILDWKDPIW